tara:strand:+ start:1751 stop:2833 length:1083 start_codon:yes stop_codon:yes gene_type:complete
MRFNLIFFILLSFFATSTAHAYLCDLEFAPIHRLDGTRALQELSKTKVGTFNVLNLEFSPGKYVYNPQTKTREFLEGTIKKDPNKVKEIAKIIKEEDLDILILQEVEGIEPLIKFNAVHLDGKYQVIMQRGNDTRGIEIGFLIKKDLPFTVMLHSHSSRKVTAESGKEEKIFSRDVPSLHIRFNDTSATDPPDLIISGTHYKSQRDRKNDPGSRKLRARQVEETKKILQEYKEVYPNTPVLLGGDFNADIHNSPEFSALFEDGFLKDSFDIIDNPLSKEARITQTFHPWEGPTKQSQLDAILVDENATSLINDAKVYRYKDVNGKERPIPQSYIQREQNPSDHFMVFVEADLYKLRQSSR